MLLEMALGDSYGMAWEFAPEQKAPNDLSTLRANPRHPEFPAGSYSDDTMRALANASIVMAGEHRWYQPSAYARAYQTAYTADRRQGWSRRFQTHLEERHLDSPESFMRDLRRRPSRRRWWRVATLGFLPDEASIRLAATCQCVSTHSAGAEAPAQAIALAAHFLLHDKGAKADLPGYLAEEVDWYDAKQRSDVLQQGSTVLPRPAMPAWTIAACAFAVIADHDSLSSMLRSCVDLGGEAGGDTDSLAAVVMAVASCSKEVADDLPANLVDQLEDEARRESLRGMDHRLRDFAGLKTPGRRRGSCA